MRMMQRSVEHRGDRSGIAEDLPLVADRPV
jgi:hypothetical protein